MEGCGFLRTSHIWECALRETRTLPAGACSPSFLGFRGRFSRALSSSKGANAPTVSTCRAELDKAKPKAYLPANRNRRRRLRRNSQIRSRALLSDAEWPALNRALLTEVCRI